MLDTSPANRRRLSGPGLRTFIAIADLWRLNQEERLIVLGGPSPAAYSKWCEHAAQHSDITLDADVLMRISAVIGIHMALNILYEDEQDGVAWLRDANRTLIFGGKSPMGMLLSDTQDGLNTVRWFLDAECSGAYMSPQQGDPEFPPFEPGDFIVS